MRGPGDDHAAGVRIRSAAPIAALAFPVLLMLAAAVNATLPCSGDACQDLERRSLVLFVVATPPVALLAALPGSLPLLVTLVAGGVAGLPLWAVVGRWLARRSVERSCGTPRWRSFWLRYAIVVAAWSSLAFLALRLSR